MSTPASISDPELLAWLDEDLAIGRMAEIEQSLRTSVDLQKRLTILIQERDQGTVTLGEVWRRHRLSCPTRHELGSFLLGAADVGVLDYIRFHLETVGCRICLANLEDLKQSQAALPETIERRKRIFTSSAGKLPEDKG